VGKTHRGKGLKDQVRHGRTECPVCKRTAVKVVFEVTVKEKTIKVCKTCKASIANGKMQKEVEALVPAGAAAPAPGASS
jgi:ribosomal protein L37AE/L43A